MGAEVLIMQIEEFVRHKDKHTYLGTACPAFISLIEKHYPELIEYLIPFASPMLATALLIREYYKNVNVKIIFIGPCIAKKAEAMESQFNGIIDSVLTFEELKKMFIQNGIDLNTCPESEFDGYSSKKGRLFALPNGLIDNLSFQNKFEGYQFICIHDDKECSQMLDYLTGKQASLRLVDVLMCDGCIEGPKVSTSLNHYDKINILYDFYLGRQVKEMNLNMDLDLSRTFLNRRTILSMPTEDEIQHILQMTDKYSSEDELNCGACGYSTCRHKAIAVINNIAEVNMCLPYLLSKKTKLYESLNEKHKEILHLKDKLEATIESSYDGIVVTDGDGEILMSNSAWAEMVGLEKNNKGKQVQEIEDMGIIFPSATVLALKEKRRISFIQSSKNGKRFLATGTPIFDSEGSIKMVVTNIRDIDELYRLKKNIESTMALQKYYPSKNKTVSNLNIKNDNIIANSVELGNVLQTAGSVAAVNSTVLLLGESGVGKEVVARFIHRLSRRSSKPLITINCSAIPENLLESELFGYETGAFTGAQKNGKQGLIELANNGTLFLDEIGDLPLSLQAKLLRVLQERKLMRLGGTSEICLDVRVIAATNKDIQKMVLDGSFRADLYYRLNVVPIEIPPLRKRKADILSLCYHFIKIYNEKYNCTKEISASVEQVLEGYSWPGNVRELENLIERLIVTTSCDMIDICDLPNFLFENNDKVNDKIKVDGLMTLKEAQEILEKKLIERAYKKTTNSYEMAEILGVNQSTIIRKIHKYIKSNALLHD